MDLVFKMVFNEKFSIDHLGQVGLLGRGQEIEKVNYSDLFFNRKSFLMSLLTKNGILRMIFSIDQSQHLIANNFAIT